MDSYEIAFRNKLAQKFSCGSIDKGCSLSFFAYFTMQIEINIGDKMAEPRLYRGMRDYLPEQMILREKIIDTIRGIFRKWGYLPLETPAIELLDTLLGKYGDEADKLIYHIEHEDGLGLRYDLTVPLSRVVALNAQTLPSPFRRYQIQPVWRAERAQKQKGRFREFVQCDVDVVGSTSPITDAEILSITCQALDALGFEKYAVLVNHREILRGLIEFSGFAADEEFAVLRVIDKWDKIGRQNVFDELCERFPREKVTEIVELVDMPLEGCNEHRLSEMKKIDTDRITKGCANLRKILDFTTAFGISTGKIIFSPRMARGLDYYTGAIFETILPNLPEMGSLTGGGRYDGLIGSFAKGREFPACGTSLGLDRIVSAMDELGMLGKEKTFTKVLIAQFSDEFAKNASKLACVLREASIECEIFPDAKKIGRQFEYADKWSIPFVALIGEDEAAEDKCKLKNLKTGEQFVMTFAQTAEFVASFYRASCCS